MHRRGRIRKGNGGGARLTYLVLWFGRRATTQRCRRYHSNVDARSWKWDRRYNNEAGAFRSFEVGTVMESPSLHTGQQDSLRSLLLTHTVFKSQARGTGGIYTMEQGCSLTMRSQCVVSDLHSIWRHHGSTSTRSDHGGGSSRDWCFLLGGSFFTVSMMSFGEDIGQRNSHCSLGEVRVDTCVLKAELRRQCTWFRQWANRQALGSMTINETFLSKLRTMISLSVTNVGQHVS